MSISHVSRRAFVAGGVLASGMSKAAMAVPTNPDVVVIGAGSAGIGAARRLIAERRSVVVIEAANRIGGRACTDTTTFGIPYDTGCAWLQGPRSLPHLDVIDRMGFTKLDHSNADEAFFVDGRRATRSETAQYYRAYDALYEDVVGKGDVAAADVIRDLPFMPTAKSWTAMSHAVDMDNLSTADMSAYGDYEVDYLTKEGLGRVVQELGRDIPVQLNTAVTEIDWGGDGVKVTTSDGSISATACIITVSTGVLASGAIRFKPEMPVEKQQAVTDVPMGLFTKIALQFDGERFDLIENEWLSYDVPREQPETGCFFVTWPTGADLAVGMIGGDHAWDVAARGADTAIELALETFANQVGSDARKHFIKGHMSDWHANPHTLGAYAAARPGRFSARDVLKEPLGERVFFAGEALAVPLAALCSGAHLSGEAAADKVNEKLRESP